MFFFFLLWKLIEALGITIPLLLIAGFLGNLLAIPLALSRLSSRLYFWVPAYLYILCVRGTPLLVQIYFLYYGLGSLFADWSGIRESFFWPYLRQGFWYVALALILNTAGYSGEVFRGAIQAVPFGEIEAARAFGMKRGLLLRRIILPRAFRIALPTLSGETILLLKATALASTVAVMDVMQVMRWEWARTFRVYECLIAAAIIYFLLTFVITRIFNLFEKHLSKDRQAASTLAMVK